MVIPVEGALDIHVMDELLARLASASGEPEVTLDLQRMRDVSIASTAWLIASLRSLRQSGTRIAIVKPPDTSPAYFRLKWFRFFVLLEDLDILPIGTLSETDREQSATGQKLLLPLATVQSNIDVQYVIASVMDNLQHSLDRLQYGKKDIGNLSLIVSEACRNICDHAGDEAIGVFAAELMRDDPPKLMIGLADDGCGLRDSLLRAHADAEIWTDEEVIRQALTKGISGIVGEERGLGLSTIIAELSRYRGTLYLRSGRARLRRQIGPKGDIEEHFFTTEVEIPGTMLSMSLLARSN